MSWTDERVEKLKKMWGEGQSASTIAKELGGVTRNAVIGKVHRLGLSNRNGGGGSDTAAKAAPKAAPETKAAKAAPAPEPAPAPVQTPALRKIVPAGQPLPPQPSANEISPEALTCKWPVGDPATDDFWFCGLAVQQGKPYCEAHVGVAFQPMSSRRDRKR